MTPRWFILTSLDPQDTLWNIERNNEQRVTDGNTAWRFFVPYRFLERKVPDELPEREGESLLEQGYRNPLSKSQVRESNAIRTTLRKFVFVEATERELAEFLAQDWNRLAVKHVQFYRSGERRRVSVAAKEMERFIAACTDLKWRFELFPALDDIQPQEEVILNTTGFRGEKARVLAVTHTKHGIRLTLALDLFSGTMILRLPDVSEKDIIRRTPTAGEVDHRHLIDRIQSQLLDILARVVLRKQTPETKAADAETLRDIYDCRHHQFADESAQRHFLALMLICASLLRDKEGIRQFTERVALELNTINAKSESRAATDTRTYLQVALFIATGKPEYRNAAKAYIATRNPHSEPLRQFVRLIRKNHKPTT